MHETFSKNPVQIILQHTNLGKLLPQIGNMDKLNHPRGLLGGYLKGADTAFNLLGQSVPRVNQTGS